MNIVRNTWLGSIVALVALGAVKPAAAADTTGSDVVETRMTRIAETLKLREQQLPAEGSLRLADTPANEVASWLKGGRGSFLDGRGGGFLNGRGWRDGGFYNRQQRRYYQR